MPLAGSNVTRIEDLADFPAAVAGVITLAANTVYQIIGAIDIGANRLVMDSNSRVEGAAPTISSISSTTTGNLITSATSFTMEGLALSCPSGAAFSLTGTTAEIALLKSVTILSCTSCGSITTWGFLVMAECAVFGTSVGGFSFTGTQVALSVVQSLYQGHTGTLFDLGTSTFDTVFIGPNVQIDTQGGATGLTVAASSANINAGGRGLISNCVFTGAGTPIVGYSHRDLLWAVEGNQGVTGTFVGAQGYILGSALNTTFTGIGAGNAKIINFGTAFLVDAGIEDQFTTSNTGRFTYIGEEDRQFFVDATLFANVTGGAARQYVFTAAINGAQVVASSSKREYTGSTPGSHSVSAMVELSKNDYIEIYVYAATATTDLNVDTASIKIRAN